MKIFVLVCGALLLVIGVLSKISVFTVTLRNGAALYESDKSEPLADRVVINQAPAGTRLQVLECIDTSSDQYLKVTAPGGNVGYLYDLNVDAAISLGAPKQKFANTFTCALSLMGKFR